MNTETRAALKPAMDKDQQYVTATEHGLAWAGANRRSVLVSALILLAVILAVVAAVAIYHHRSEKASEAFGAAMQAYQTPLAAPGQQVPPGIKTFASVSDRAKVANGLFLAAANQYGLTPDGRNAKYFAGLTYIEAGQNGSAESTLKQVAGGWDHELASLAKLALAELYRQTGRDSQAIDLYNELTSKPTTAVPAGTAQLQLAELYQTEGKPDAARKIYAELKDKDSKGAAGLIAAQKLNPAAAPNPRLAR